MLERRDPSQPFFMQLGFHGPDPPFDPPVEFFERDRDAFYRQCQSGSGRKASTVLTGRLPGQCEVAALRMASISA